MGDDQRYPRELIESMSELSKLVVANEDLSSTVTRIAELAVQAIDGAEVCSVSLARKGEITTVASTAEIGVKVDEIQYEAKEGPCLSSIDEQEAFQIPDMKADDTWPVFSKRVAEETDTNSMLAYVLNVHKGTVGALNLTSSKVDSFSSDDLATGALFAAQAGVALANALTHEDDQNQIHQLEEGLETRQVIGQAVGLIMAAHKVDADEGFKLLVRTSQNTNEKVRDLAQRVIERKAEP